MRTFEDWHAADTDLGYEGWLKAMETADEVARQLRDPEQGPVELHPTKTFMFSGTEFGIANWMLDTTMPGRVTLRIDATASFVS